MPKSRAKLALSFATRSGRDVDKFLNAPFSPSPTGIPVLTDGLTWLECSVIHVVDTGDRRYLFANVIHAESRSDEAVLRESDLMAAASDEERWILAERRERDIQALGPPSQAWLDSGAKRR